MKKIKHDKRQQRKHVTCECFTPEYLVNDIIKKLLIYNSEILNSNKTILDPACGNGGILIPIIKYRLQIGIQPLQAIRTVYGCDIRKDNIEQIKSNIMALLPVQVKEQALIILNNNIIYLPKDKYPQGSIDYFRSSQHIFQ